MMGERDGRVPAATALLDRNPAGAVCPYGLIDGDVMFMP